MDGLCDEDSVQISSNVKSSQYSSHGEIAEKNITFGKMQMNTHT